MIIKGLRVSSTSGINRLVHHLQNGEGNDSVEFLRGTPEDIKDMHSDAFTARARYSARHWIIAPHERMTRAQVREVLDSLAAEFGFDALRAVVVEHGKTRATSDAFDRHWHVLVGEVDPLTGRILATSFDWVRHEIIARASEFKFGHRLVPGKHTLAAIKGLRKRNLPCIADWLEKAFDPESKPRYQAFSHGQHQEKARQGIDLAAYRQLVKITVELSTCASELSARLATSGLRVRTGDKQGTWIVEISTDGTLVGALHRLAGKRKSEIGRLMATESTDNHQTGKELDSSETSRSPELPPPPVRIPGLNSGATATNASLADSLTEPSVLRRLRANLNALETAARSDLVQVVPSFRPTPEMHTATEKLRETKRQVLAAEHLIADLREQLRKARPVRWWSHLFGTASSMTSKRKALDASLQAATANLNLQFTIQGARHRTKERIEQEAKVNHAALERQTAALHDAARLEIAVIAIAKRILEDAFDARLGIGALMAKARERYSLEKRVSESLSDLATGPDLRH